MFERGIHFRNNKIHWKYKGDYAPHCEKDPPLRALPFPSVITLFVGLAVVSVISVFVLIVERFQAQVKVI